MLISIALVICIEEAGVPFLFPGDVTMVVAGMQVARGHASLASVLLVEEVATLVGAGFLFYLSRRYGRSLVVDYGWWIGVGPAQLHRVEERLARRGTVTIIFGRLLPGLRIVTVVACGVAGVPAMTFFPALAVGGFLYLLGFTLLGYYIGTPVLQLLARLALPASALWSVGAVVVLLLGARVFRGGGTAMIGIRGSVGEVVIGGLFAGLVGLFAANALVSIAASVSQLEGRQPVLGLLRADEIGRLLLGWPMFMASAVAVMWVYRSLRLDRFPLLIRVLLTGGVPLLTSLLLLVLLGGPSASTSSTLPVLVVSVLAIRWVVFALVIEIAHGGSSCVTPRVGSDVLDPDVSG